MSSLATENAAASSYGVLSWLQKDNLYWFGDRGFIYTTPWVVTPRTVRYHAMLLLTASGDPFELRVGDRTLRSAAAALAPLTPRGLCARDLGQVSVHIGIRHPCFTAFRWIREPGVLELDRSAFRRFDRALVAAYEGRLDDRDARRLFEDLVATTVSLLPAPRPRDPRCDLVGALVGENPAIRLSEMARQLEVSYTTASELFSQAIGLPLRAYRFGRKCERAAKRLLSEAPLTELALDAGFTDSAHFTRSWQRSFGHPPSYTRDARHVTVRAIARSERADPTARRNAPVEERHASSR